MPGTWEERSPNYVVRGGELIMNLTAQSLADEFLGRVCMTSPDEHCLLNQRLARISPLVGFEPRYALHLLKSRVFRVFVNSLNTGSLIQHMFTSQLDAFVFQLPPADEQNQILRIVDTALSNVDPSFVQISNQIVRSPLLRQSILKRAFNGNLVSNPCDSPLQPLRLVTVQD